MYIRAMSSAGASRQCPQCAAEQRSASLNTAARALALLAIVGSLVPCCTFMWAGAVMDTGRAYGVSGRAIVFVDGVARATPAVGVAVIVSTLVLLGGARRYAQLARRPGAVRTDLADPYRAPIARAVCPHHAPHPATKTDGASEP